MNKIKVIEYSVKYILMVIIANYINLVIGFIPNLYSLIILIPIINYLVLMWGIIKPLNKEKISKKDMHLPFIVVTSIFNIIFFSIQSFDILHISIIVISNIVEFHLMNTEKVKIKDITGKNIKEYFHNKKNL
jgi:hypothetical protein